MILQTESLTEPEIQFEAPDFTNSMYFVSAAERPMKSSGAVRFKCSVFQALPLEFPPISSVTSSFMQKFLAKIVNDLLGERHCISRLAGHNASGTIKMNHVLSPLRCINWPEPPATLPRSAAVLGKLAEWYRSVPKERALRPKT